MGFEKGWKMGGGGLTFVSVLHASTSPLSLCTSCIVPAPQKGWSNQLIALSESCRKWWVISTVRITQQCVRVGVLGCWCFTLKLVSALIELVLDSVGLPAVLFLC
jgi:hypothetical protein